MSAWDEPCVASHVTEGVVVAFRQRRSGLLGTPQLRRAGMQLRSVVDQQRNADRDIGVFGSHFTAIAENKQTEWRRILVRLQGAAAGA